MLPLISAQQLTKEYRRGTQVVRALDSVSFHVAEGEFLAIVGPSGSGKSTLLNLIGCMDSATSGSLLVAGKDISSADEKLKVQFRRKYVGFVFQHFGLIATLTVEENILLPHVFARGSDHDDLERLLTRLNLADRRQHRPAELSGGEMQRVAIARALYNKPKLLLADEPTGNLDSASADSILDLLRQLNGEGLSIMVVTHNPQLAAATDRQISLKDGRIVSESRAS
jgi:ABC-type lipoprotein export system ATPase subunit